VSIELSLINLAVPEDVFLDKLSPPQAPSVGLLRQYGLKLLVLPKLELERIKHWRPAPLEENALAEVEADVSRQIARRSVLLFAFAILSTFF
jgi:hypothetical protein